MKVKPYEGYYAFVSYDVIDRIYYGTVMLNNKDLVDFIADTKDNVEEQFHKAIDDYLEFCKEIRKEPQMSGGTK